MRAPGPAPEPIRQSPQLPKRSLLARAALSLLLIAMVAGFTALGIWQLHRRAWKLDLIARVDARVQAPPVAAPGPAAWPAVTADKDEYLKVKLSGRYLVGKQTYVHAVSDFGDGYWVMTPFVTARGFIVLVNRGFAPPGWIKSAATAPSQSETSVVGLVRMTEPKGGFLRPNVPAAGRWYSRDVAAIAAARHLRDVAPYFVDAARAKGQGWPRGGLTVISFPNNHLVYAITWFALALLFAGMTLRQWLVRDGE